MDLSNIIKEIQPCVLENPYIFISYSSQDRELVWEDVLEFQRRGYNVWLDEKNLDKSKASWKEDALTAIEDMECELVVFYVSAHSLCSDACYREMMKTTDRDTCDMHNGPVKFIAIDAQEIGNITEFKNRVYASLRSMPLDKEERKTRIKALQNFIREIFNSNNDRVRIHPRNEENRKTDYYEDILAAFPDSTLLVEKSMAAAAPIAPEPARREDTESRFAASMTRWEEEPEPEVDTAQAAEPQSAEDTAPVAEPEEPEQAEDTESAAEPAEDTAPVTKPQPMEDVAPAAEPEQAQYTEPATELEPVEDTAQAAEPQPVEDLAQQLKKQIHSYIMKNESIKWNKIPAEETPTEETLTKETAVEETPAEETTTEEITAEEAAAEEATAEEAAARETAAEETTTEELTINQPQRSGTYWTDTGLSEEDLNPPLDRFTTVDTMETDKNYPPKRLKKKDIALSRKENGLYEIPEGYTEIEFKIIGSYYANTLDMVRLILPDSISKVPSGEFKGCRNLREVRLSRNLQFIELESFKDCESLQYIEIPGKVETIAHGAFQNCRSLKSIKLPLGLKELGNVAFENSNLMKIDLPPSLEKIGSSCFASCASLQYIVIPGSVKTVDLWGFYNCSNLNKIVLMDGVQKIEKGPFRINQRGINIWIPDSVTEISEGAKSVLTPAVIHCHQGSFAEKYALQNGLNVQLCV